MKIFVSLKVYICSYVLIFSAMPIYAAEDNSPTFNIKEFTLPSEVKDLAKSSGAIYFSPSIKGKVLIPVHFWGAVNRSGLHFVPVNTTFVNGLSMAGGPGVSADLAKIRLTRKNLDKMETLRFDLSSGGNALAYEESLKPGDSVFVPRDTYLENRAYYTSLVGVFATVLSSILLYRKVTDK